jgi:hypothetical protein
MKAITSAPAPPAPSRVSAPAVRTRLPTPFKLNGRIVEATWYMDQPYGEVKDLLPGVVVRSGEAIRDTDTPAALKLDLESVVFLMPRGSVATSAEGTPLVAIPSGPVPVSRPTRQCCCTSSTCLAL